jgi:cobalt-zinc-cadmium efflux system membrane fusion protein
MVPVRPSPLRPFTGILVATTLSIAALALVPHFGLAHEGGHDQDDSERALLAASTFPRIVAKSETFELVGILKNDRLSIYLDRVPSNGPVTGAKVTVTIADAEPANTQLSDDGTYTLLRPQFPGSGTIDVVFNISEKGGDDLLIGTLRLSQDLSEAAASGPVTWSRWITAVPWAIRHPVALTLAILGLGILFTRYRHRSRPIAATAAASMLVFAGFLAVTLGAEDQPPGSSTKKILSDMSDAPRRLPGGAAFIAKPTQRLLEVRTAAAVTVTASPAVTLIARVIGDPNRTGVVQSLHGGRVLPLEGGLPHIGQSVRKGEPLVRVDPYLPLADRTTISEKTGEIEQLMAVAESKIRRLRPLAERGAVPQSQVNDLETELEGLRLRREAVRTSRTELELLRAPTDGVIAAVKIVAGQVVQAQDSLFQIVDPQGLLVEALVYGALDPESLADATATTTSGQVLSLSFRGFSRALQQQASIVQFTIPDPPANLSVGQPLTVIAKSGTPVTGLIVPKDAVVRNANGEAVVWLSLEPERFEARPVRTRPFDATRLIIAGGLMQGDRVVIRGADLVNQIR